MVERNHSVPVQGQHRFNMFGDDVQNGDFKVDEAGTYLLCVCPCGCGSMMNLPLYMLGTPKEAIHGDRAAWSWNGDRERPSLQPSIRDLSGCHFHGFLTDGQWTFCPDSGVGGK
jgi:hypothetical protein